MSERERANTDEQKRASSATGQKGDAKAAVVEVEKNKSHLAEAALRAAAAPLLLSRCGCASARGARENEVEAIPRCLTEREEKQQRREELSKLFRCCVRASNVGRELVENFSPFNTSILVSPKKKHAALCFSSDAVEDDGAVNVDDGIEASPPRPSPRKSLCRGLKERRRRRRQAGHEEREEFFDWFLPVASLLLN